MQDILFWVLMFIAGHLLIGFYGNQYDLDQKDKNTLVLLFYYHIAISLFYGWLYYWKDAGFYWRGYGTRGIFGETWMDFYGINTHFIFFLNYPFTKIMNLNFYTGMVLYGLVGYLGFIYLFLIMKSRLPFNPRIGRFKLFPLILFLPNMHFWSSGIGKDSLCFFGLAWFFYGLLSPQRRLIQIGLSVALLYHVRPHMALIALAGAGIALLLSGDLKPVYKTFAVMVLIASSYLIFDQVFAFLGIEDPSSMESFEALADAQIDFLNRSSVGSAVDLASYSWPMRLFTYLYRPLFFDAHNFTSFLASFENFIYLILTLVVLVEVNLIKAWKLMPTVVKGGFIAFAGSAVAFSNSLSNLGIIMRMKNMTMIYFLIFIVFALSYQQYEVYKQKKRRMEFFKAKRAMRIKEVSGEPD